FQAPAPLLGPPGPILQDGQSVPAPRSPAGGQSLFLRRCLLHPTTPSAPFLCGAWSWGHGGGAGSGPGPVARTLRRRASALEDVVLDVALPLALTDDPHGHMGPVAGGDDGVGVGARQDPGSPDRTEERRGGKEARG